MRVVGTIKRAPHREGQLRQRAVETKYSGSQARFIPGAEVVPEDQVPFVEAESERFKNFRVNAFVKEVEFLGVREQR